MIGTDSDLWLMQWFGERVPLAVVSPELWDAMQQAKQPFRDGKTIIIRNAPFDTVHRSLEIFIEK